MKNHKENYTNNSLYNIDDCAIHFIIAAILMSSRSTTLCGASVRLMVMIFFNLWPELANVNQLKASCRLLAPAGQHHI